MDILQEIDARRRKEGWTRLEAAEQLGISYSMFRGVLHGRRRMGLRFCEGLARVWPDLKDAAIEAAMANK